MKLPKKIRKRKHKTKKRGGNSDSEEIKRLEKEIEDLNNKVYELFQILTIYIPL